MIETGITLLALGAVVLFVVCFTAGLEWVPRSKLVRGLGVIARIATYSGIAVAIWRLYPPLKDIFGVPLAQFTLGDIAHTIFYVLIFLVLGRIFLNFPDTDDDYVWEQWEGFGLTGAFVAGGSAIYCLSHALV